MTLSSTVLFPQAMMPLFIFEPRYRQMLQEVLLGNRIFAVAALDEESAGGDTEEPPHSIAGIGIVRACQKNPDGTANLILQGLARVQFDSIVTEQPFRKARIHQIASELGGNQQELDAIQPDIIALVKTQIRLGAAIPKEVVQFLSNMKDPEGMLDLAIFTLCSSSNLKQRLLETREIIYRYKLFKQFLLAEIAQLQIDRKLKGGLDEGEIGNN
jgi:ATP-dependent Lon protease